MRGLRPGTLSGAAVIASLSISPLTKRIVDPDLWWHLKSGEVLLARGWLPAGDLFSFTVPGKRWIAHEWGSEVVMQAINDAFGLRGIIVWRGAMIVALSLVVATVLVRAGGNRPGTWAIVALTLVAGSDNWTERPNLFSYFFFAITLAWVLRRDRRVWLVVPLTMLWANMHAMVLLGVGLVFLVAIVEWMKVALRWEGSDTAWAKRLSIVGGAATLAAMVNPFGPALFGHSFFLVRVVGRFNTEWASPNFHAVVPLVFLALVLIAVAGIALSDRRADPTDVALLLAFVSLGLFARRNMLLAAIVAGYVAARYAPAALDVVLARRRGRRDPEGRIPVPPSIGVLAALVAFGVAAVATQFPRSGSLAHTLEPTQPVALVRSLPDGDVRLFARDYWAGFALWTRWPDVRVAFDGRVDLYGSDVQDAYVRTSDAEPGWDRYLDEVCATHVLMPESAGLHAALDGHNAWTRIGTEVVRVPNALTQERLAVLWERRFLARGCPGT